MAKVNKDGSFDNRSKGGKNLNAKRRTTAFIIGLITTIVTFIGFLFFETAEDAARAALYAAIIGVIVGGLASFIIKRFNRFIGRF